MAKDSNIITFRATQETLELFSKLKSEGKMSNTSEFINERLLSYNKDTSAYTCVIRTIPEDLYPLYKQDPLHKQDPLLVVKLHSRPISELSVKRLAEIRNLIDAEGLQYHYFKIDSDNTVSFIAANREEASRQFQEYFIWNEQEKRYLRTLRPLPQYRYDSMHNAIIIIQFE